ncbi:PREDICTED: PH domain leucine-rich repeat-containing protein phosphatase 2-like [Priapulus caudatus]|uniref:PH domain leucine-rich repeat-containing protein phosphatase 2-like n=1 Tax=Priapulus caudatus TaxID=37621 RepID=A0ABM1EZX4_PRICU|nr:PREDICTED: PH domain leucine-rich repeat-containing protein phosphatase 2-like [Priapulus caudatus]
MRRGTGPDDVMYRRREQCDTVTVRSHYSVLSSRGRAGHNWWKEFMMDEEEKSGSRSSSSRSPDNRPVSTLSDELGSWETTTSATTEPFSDKDRSPTGSSSSSFSRAATSGATVDKPDPDAWLCDTNHGYVRVYDADTTVLKSRCLPCSLATTAHQICLKLGALSNALHVQYNGGVIKRLEAYDPPLALQNEYLSRIGYADVCRMQEVGQSKELGYLLRFYVGKPVQDGTFTRNNVSGVLYVRKGKLFHQWAKRMCMLSGTRLLVYPGVDRRGTPHVYQLATGRVEEVKFKNHERCLKVTSEMQGGRCICLSFSSDSDLTKWLRKCTKAAAKLPNLADLSNNHLEYIPENLFVNDRLSQLNLRHNALKERPIEEDIYTIGWVDDLPSFQNLHSLNLSDTTCTCSRAPSAGADAARTERL